MDSWSHYDSEGYIHTFRKSQKFGDYIHQGIEYDEGIKKLEWEEVLQKIQEQNRELEEQWEKIQRTI